MVPTAMRPIRRRGRRRLRLRTARGAAPLLVGFALILAACGSGGSPGSTTTAQTRPSTTAKLSLVTPTQGEVFTTSTIPVKVSLEGGRIVAITSTNLEPNEGHLHLYLDNLIVSMNYRSSAVLHDVTPGTHVVRVEFVATDHAPFDPRLFVEVTITVQA